MLGVVNLDKPVGPTSHDMVGLLRRLTGIRRIGHAGTLDPLASGVLPILVGSATRFSAELTGGRKRYDATIRLGARSATDDAEGPIEPVDAPLPDEPALRAALATFVGRQAQRPPAYSARKLGGRTAHRAARGGQPLDLPPRDVEIHGLELLALDTGPGWVDVRVDLRCSAGTYVRSIARDLGQRLGTGGYLHALRRTQAGPLTLDGSISPEGLEALAAQGKIGEALLPVGPLLSLPRVSLDADAAWRFLHGSVLPARGHGAPGRVAVFEGDRLLGIGLVDAAGLHPQRVVPSETSAS